MDSSGPQVHFTIFTAAFNRPNLLKRAWQSLEAQTVRGFEWVIVDDGSGHEVRAAIEGIQQNASFPVHYFWQPNQGKHVAHNRAVQEARGSYFAVLDDDDTLMPQAIERMAFHWGRMSEGERQEFVSLIGLCVDQDGEPHSGPVAVTEQTGALDVDYIEFAFKLGYRGERWGSYRTEVLRQFPYPVAAGKSAYMLEGVTWMRMARFYKTRFVNEVWRVWHTGHISQSSEGARKLIDYQRIARNQVIFHRLMFVELGDQFRYAPRQIWLGAAHYTRFSLHAGDSLAQMWRGATGTRAKALWLTALPFGVAGWLRDQPVMRRRKRATPEGFVPEDLPKSHE